MPKKSEDSAAIKAAKEYVQRQIATMKAHGSAPKLTADALKTMVHQVAQATK